MICIRRALAATALLIVTAWSSPVMAQADKDTAELRKLNREAQALFDRKDYGAALGLWLSYLDKNPKDEKIQQKIEIVYEIKLQKDLALQKFRAEYRFAMDKFKKDSDEEKKLGLPVGKDGIESYIVSFRTDPYDSEVKRYEEDWRELKAEVERIQKELSYSEMKRKKVAELRKLAREMSALKYPDYQELKETWKKILGYIRNDAEALEGVRLCEMAIENRLKWEKIRDLSMMGTSFFEQKKYEPSRKCFDNVIQLDAKNRYAKMQIKKIDEILSHRQQALLNLKNAEVAYANGLRDLKENKFELAQEDFGQVVALLKEFKEVQGTIYRDSVEKLKKLSEMKEQYLRMERQKREERARQLFQDGLIAYTGGRYRDALNLFQNSLNYKPDSDQTKQYLKWTQDALKNEEEDELSKDSPYYDLVQSIGLAGKSLYGKGQYNESMNKWLSIRQLFPKNRLAREYIFKCEIRLNPASRGEMLKSKFEDGKKFMAAKKYRDALRSFEEVLSIERNYPGVAMLIDQARGGIRSAMPGGNLTQEDRDQIAKTFASAMALYEKGGAENIKKALGDFRWIVKKDPNNTKVAIIVSKIESQLGMSKPAAERVSRLTPKQQEMVNYHYYRGINFYSQNEFQKALDEWRQVLIIDPQNDRAKKNFMKVSAFLGRK